MKKLLLVLTAALCTQLMCAQKYSTKSGKLAFEASVPLFEDVNAKDSNNVTVLDTATGSIASVSSVSNFKFTVKLMEEHFNENYMETEKKVDGAYPNRNAEFKGKINETIDYTKDGENKVTITGKLTIHGVTKDVTLDGTLTKKGTEIVIYSKFKIKVADYNIKVPSMYVKNIAEEVDVTVNSTLEPFQKK